MSSRTIPTWRKLAWAAWRAPSDPQFYGELDLDATALLAYVDHVRETSGTRVTITHLIGRAVAHGLVQVPELRVRVAFGREYERETADVFFITSVENGKELSGVKITDVEHKSAVDVADELTRRHAAIVSGADPEFGRSKALLGWLPIWLLRPVMRCGAWLTTALNLDLKALGMPRQAFGGAMVTSVGMWGVRRAFSPLAAYYRMPVLVLVGAVEQRPVVVDGEVVARPVLGVTATFDHRYVDGSQAVRFAAAAREYCADPRAFEPV
ncbi:2-oxo acid dehydrogenase subunit E2 [Lentzea aerocolonigenes]|uniref:2-oxo acid dehydrogenase subunit E2 n=1 Tax=Lentzea aerocolonigenes TaxID=68170 RepID=UPI00056594C5|nr:2-oxo acid dehydrogenase subunit E2 [Lentzea aerocolonigenes]MCP2250444.1 2-oxoacid dehydrogenases acyltransferase (catalytic domain) [Lentzea aerocolonigenes]